jgi:signal transduction histidine kinase
MHITTSEIESALENGGDGQLFLFKRNFIGSSDKENVVELDRMLTRGDMAAEIAHEMNNFLTILVGNTELIPMFISNGNYEKAIGKLTVMKGTLGKIAGLSESLIEYGKIHSVETINDLNEMIESTLEFFEPQNRFDGIEMRANLAADLPPLRGDIGKIQQLIGNLIHNAADELKCAPGDSKVISITTEPSDDRASVIVRVSDTGRGVDESVRDDIFRQQCSTKPNGEGYGLLACKQIADNHAAKIAFDTVLGEGACFTLVIPAAASNDSSAVQSTDDTSVSRIHQ